MAGKRKTPLWRQTFLRALARTGNVRAAAFEAGVDKVTAYNHRRKDAGFAGKWEGALAKAKAHAAKAPRPLHHRALRGGPQVLGRPVPRTGLGLPGAIHPNTRSGEEYVLRRTRHGDKLVRAAAGRWSRRVEESFFEGLELTGCVRGAAAAAGISTNALYERRKHYVRWPIIRGAE